MLRAAGLAALTTGTPLVTGCDLFGGSSPAGPDPLRPLLTEAVDLAGRYAAAATAHPDLAALLDPIARAHRSHAAELGRLAGVPVPSDVPGGSPGAPTGDSGATLAALRSAEQRGQDSATRACLAAPAESAALLGSIAAARATHLAALA
ncbi:hypothetical protein [Micromonospora zhanjiangensis]|uniref:Ferritin-like domain-containing protein n=1 Tax=Micromonospora zhanjiangensis TaxID=1522057 RepID=A0ABV8KGX2_9ACTN